MSKFDKTALILASASVIAFSALPVLAQEDVTVVAPASKSAVIKRPLPAIKNTTSQIELTKEKLASKAAALKSKLQAFKDQKKALLAERINANLNVINQNQTRQMQKNLGIMSAILDKLEARGGTSNTILKAKETIASASSAVIAQSQKDYTITVTSETKIKADAKLARDKLHADLTAVRKLVIEAKQSVVNAIKEAKADSEKEGTVSGQQ